MKTNPDFFAVNPILLADQYKYSHPGMYPPEQDHMSCYWEARGGDTPAIVWNGLQPYIMKYLAGITITKEMVEEADEEITGAGEPFDKEGWMRVVTEHGGKIPVVIYALPEGTCVPTGIPTMVIQSTDEKLAWMASFVETLLMKTWYPVAVATKAAYIRKDLELFMESTSDNPAAILYMYHNFGDRGSSSVESADIGGAAHGIVFRGSDNTNANRFIRLFYKTRRALVSIPASEHTTVCSWGRAREFEMVDNHLEKHKNYPMIAGVADTYDVFKYTDTITSGKFKEKIESDDYPIMVIRPDSGNPVEVITDLLAIMLNNGVAWDNNSKVLKVFRKYRILWGDGIDHDTIMTILKAARKLGFAPDNFAFGSGGDLMQRVERDTHKVAIKASFVKHNGVGMGIAKDPITDPGKRSKIGRVYPKLEDGVWSVTNKLSESNIEMVYYRGDTTSAGPYTYEEVRENFEKTKHFL